MWILPVTKGTLHSPVSLYCFLSQAPIIDTGLFFPAQTRRQLLDKAIQKGPQANKFTGRVRADLVTTWKLRYQKVSQGTEGPSGDVMTI